MQLFRLPPPWLGLSHHKRSTQIQALPAVSSAGLMSPVCQNGCPGDTLMRVREGVVPETHRHMSFRLRGFNGTFQLCNLRLVGLLGFLRWSHFCLNLPTSSFTIDEKDRSKLYHHSLLRRKAPENWKGGQHSGESRIYARSYNWRNQSSRPGRAHRRLRFGAPLSLIAKLYISKGHSMSPDNATLWMRSYRFPSFLVRASRAPSAETYPCAFNNRWQAKRDIPGKSLSKTKFNRSALKGR